MFSSIHNFASAKFLLEETPTNVQPFSAKIPVSNSREFEFFFLIEFFIMSRKLYINSFIKHNINTEGGQF